MLFHHAPFWKIHLDSKRILLRKSQVFPQVHNFLSGYEQILRSEVLQFCLSLVTSKQTRTVCFSARSAHAHSHKVTKAFATENSVPITQKLFILRGKKKLKVTTILCYKKIMLIYWSRWSLGFETRKCDPAYISRACPTTTRYYARQHGGGVRDRM